MGAQDTTIAKATHIGMEASKNVDIIYGKSLAEVYKEYLPHIADCYTVAECPITTDPAESVASFEIDKLVLAQKNGVSEKLKNVYSLLAHSGNSIALIINRTHRECRLHVAVGSPRPDSEAVKNLASMVRGAFLGNFPGSDCGTVRYYSDNPGGAFCALNESARFSNVNFSSIGIVTNVATDFSEQISSQGIERLIDGIKLDRDEEFSVMLVGRSMPMDELVRKKDRLYTLYTALSPFASIQRSWGVQNSETWTTGMSLSLFGSTPQMMVPAVGLSLGASTSKGTTVGTSSTDTVTIKSYGIAHMLETIERQMERLEQCEALGLWQFAGFFLSPNVRLVSEASNMYLSLSQGANSFVERPSINVWNARAHGGSRRSEIDRLRSYLIRLSQPEFILKPEGALEYFNAQNWPGRLHCTAEISGTELTRALNLPRASVPGLPVITCAPFGREVSSFGKGMDDCVTIGKIHHMHHDEELPVALSTDSLTSHVFVTGSTGSGKSNTVCTLLDACASNYLVIEPAKGEYRHAFGSNVQVFGTNPLSDEMLRINPFSFPDGIHVYEHIDRILEVFNVCWPMYAAMPAVLKEAVIRAYQAVGWNLRTSHNDLGNLYPTFRDVRREIDAYIDSSDYSADTRGDYKGSLKTRLESLTNGINELIFCEGDTPDSDLFDSKAIVDLSRMGSSENKALVMGVLVIKLQEHRMALRGKLANERLKHITVLEEAHNLLRAQVNSGQSDVGGGIAGKSVEMLSNAIAEMRTYGEGFVIVDQSPGLLDMSVIRNTNTKIIMRLPDQSDRELVGRSANLDDEQIGELARLQRGIAAVYQNEWTEPVLCHIKRHVQTGLREGEDGPSRSLATPEINDSELRFLTSCVYNPDLIDACSEFSFDACARKLDAPDSLKALLIEMGRLPRANRREVFRRTAWEYFGIERFFESLRGQSLRGLKDLLASHLVNSFMFDANVNPMAWEGAQYRFVQEMIDVRMRELTRGRVTPETEREALELRSASAALLAVKPVKAG